MMAGTMRLSDLCDFVGVQVDPANHADGVYVGLEHVSSGRFVRAGEGKASDVLSGKYLFRAGDILYGKLRPYLDKAVLATDSGICTTELLVLRPKEGVDPRFLVGVVHAPSFIEHAVAGTTGVQHPRTSWGHIANFEIPPFDGEEQAKIADLLWEVHEAIVSNEAAVEAGGDLKRAAMRELFTRGLRGEAQKETEIGPVPESWDVAAIGDVALNTQYGLSLRGQPSGACPILRMNCQEDGAVHYRNLQFVDLDTETFEAFQLKPGDLLFNRTNSIELVGRMAIVDDDRPAVFASYLVRLTVDEKRCLPQFLNYFMNWPATQDEIKKLASRAVGQANINATKLRTVLFPLPPTLDEQREIVAILDAIDRKIDLHKKKRAVLDELFKALLHKLMTGEIQVSDLDLSVLDTTTKRGKAA
ncbi:type I restriction enzyme S subunit [Ochrobactrum sp. RH1CCR137]|nr:MULTISPECIES: restriction endonuclease subunit S [unclassified Ochrobactrum]MBA8843468.1 type I restriction enzyme S subunit [Ochrobactrum sp. RH1CCR137]MBA8855656.1 type I restriction enzyme S subunit [Ochrobactrum sp. RH1CCR134]